MTMIYKKDKKMNIIYSSSSSRIKTIYYKMKMKSSIMLIKKIFRKPVLKIVLISKTQDFRKRKAILMLALLISNRINNNTNHINKNMSCSKECKVVKIIKKRAFNFSTKNNNHSCAMISLNKINSQERASTRNKIKVTL
jgi:hypothetical protein